MRDLFVTTHTPVLRSGRAVRSYGVVRALASARPLDLLYLRFEGDEPDAAFAAIADVTMHRVVGSRGARRLAGYARARLGGAPESIARGVSPELAAAARRLAAQPERGRVIADGMVAAATLLPLARGRPVIYNAHNFESGFRHELGIPGTESPDRLRAFERGILQRAAESWMVSQADIAAALELFPGARLRYVPNVVDVAAIEPIEPFVAEQRVIFVANFAYKPNRDGLAFLLEKVMPLVWSELPGAKLSVVGAGLDGELPSDPRVQALGFVDELRSAYATASCAVVPLLVGGGTPLKLIEALAYGLPVVATTRAVAGLELTGGEHCLIADDAESFAAAVTRVMRDGAGEMARRGRERAAELYSIEALSRLLKT